MAKIGLPKGSGKWLKVREKSVKSQGIFKWILSGNPEYNKNKQETQITKKDPQKKHRLGTVSKKEYWRD